MEQQQQQQRSPRLVAFGAAGVGRIAVCVQVGGWCCIALASCSVTSAATGGKHGACVYGAVLMLLCTHCLWCMLDTLLQG
jgi:hypothetical protein